jgi:hypothetical protein
MQEENVERRQAVFLIIKVRICLSSGHASRVCSNFFDRSIINLKYGVKNIIINVRLTLSIQRRLAKKWSTNRQTAKLLFNTAYPVLNNYLY